MKSCPVASPLVVAILLGGWLGTCIQQAYRLPGYQSTEFDKHHECAMKWW